MRTARRKRPYAKQKAGTFDDALRSLETLKLQEQQLQDSNNEAIALEQILLELVETQEHAMDFLHKWEPVLQQHRDKPPQQQPPWQEQLQRIRSSPSSSTSSQAGKINNAMRMLQAATEADVLLAAALTADAWRQYSADCVTRLSLLLDLAQKPWLADACDPPQPTAASAGSAAAPSPSPSAAAAAPNAEAAAGGGLHSMPADMVLPSAAIWQQVEAVFDEYFKYGFLSLFVNPNALVEACATNFVTGEPAAAPPQHWRAVVRRMNPTDEQLQHLKIGLQLHERIERGLQQRITPILEKAVDATPLLQMTHSHLANAADNTGATAGAIAGATAASAAVSGPTGTTPSSGSGGSGSGSGSGGSSSIGSKVAVVSAAAAAAAAAEQQAEESGENDDSIDGLLQRAVQYRHLNLVTAGFLVNNTLSKLQGCIAMVAAWPFGPVAVATAQACAEELEDRKQQQQQSETQHLEPDRAGRRSWLLESEKAAAGRAQGSGAGGAQGQQRGRSRQSAASAGGSAGASPSWPTLHELVHRNAHYHMQQRVAELEARRQAWAGAEVPVPPPL